ncbi:cellulase family glycosylhydrolase [Lachnoclostridium sp.]|nr:cellulase family glycosylhydrolase [Lachnoclostridium sp.]
MNRFLKVVGSKVINGLGENIIFRGVNLGGWLIQESWMCPVSGEDRKWANLDTLNVLKKRFTEEEVQEIFDTYQDHWITETDIKIIFELGCNVLRVPFWYRNFMADEEGTWIHENFDKNPGFKRIDWIIQMAERYGMYVILDLHGCPGGQSMDHCCGTLARNSLYTNAVCQESMKKLWVAIANRYKDTSTIAAYDIMNEPQNNTGYEGENSYDPWKQESWEMTNQIYDSMIKAIRDTGDNHIITVEGIWRVSNLPDPREMGWTNMMYQTHLYDDDQGFKQWVEDMAATMSKYGVAGYIGEFQNLNGIKMCEENNISWTTWSYKGTNNDVGTFFCYFANSERVDVEKDSLEIIKQKWGEKIETKNFDAKNKVIEYIKNSTRISSIK